MEKVPSSGKRCAQEGKGALGLEKAQLSGKRTPKVGKDPSRMEKGPQFRTGALKFAMASTS